MHLRIFFYSVNSRLLLSARRRTFSHSAVLWRLDEWRNDWI